MSDVRILLLEASSTDAQRITHELEVLGMNTIRLVSNREDFIEALSSFRPSLVLADSRGAFGASEALHLAREIESDLPFILVSETSDEHLAEDLLRAGADDYLLKDRLGRLGTAIKHALRLRELRAQLVDRESLLRRVFDTEPECVKLLDEEGKLIEMNRAGLEMLEVDSIDDVRYKSVYPFIVPEYREQFREGVRRVFAGESLRAQFQMVGTRGTRLWMETNAVPLLDAGGKITCLLAITRDITRSKELEEQFRQSQKLEAVGRLAGGVAHDFNNILTIISGYATMTMAIPGIDSDTRKNASGIQNSVLRASGLTKQLLAFSRRQISQPLVLDLNLLLTTVSALITRVIGEDIRLTLHLESNAGNIKADPSQIEQVVMNLAVNARDAMPNGGTISIETAAEDLAAPLERNGFRCEPGRYLRMSVKDSGTGMNSEILPHIFDPFFTTKEQGKGTGLGLSTVYGIVQQCGGAVIVNTEIGKGTTVEVYFPITSLPVTSPVNTETVHSGGNERILVVEDDQELGDLVRRMLAKFGYRVIVMSNAPAAIRLLDTDRDFQLILTDIVMPGMSGLQLVRQIEDRGFGIKTLYMTGYSEDYLALREKHGIPEGTRILEKPFNPEVLAATVRGVLDARPYPSSATAAFSKPAGNPS